MLKSAAQLPVGDKSVLITGCDTGFGLVLAKHLHGLGFRVFAGCLLKKAEGPGAKELEEVAEKCQNKRMSVLQLDVTKDEDWDKAFELVNEVGNFVVNVGRLGDLVRETVVDDFFNILLCPHFGNIFSRTVCLVYCSRNSFATPQLQSRRLKVPHFLFATFPPRRRLAASCGAS